MNREKALNIFNKLKEISDNFHMAGSLRRGKKENIGDLDVVHFGKKLPEISNDYVMESGDEIVRLKIDGEQVDIYKTNEMHFGAMLLHLTGSKDFNIHLRALAKENGWKLNQIGLYDEDDNLIASKTEKNIFDALHLPYYEPFEREIRTNSNKNVDLSKSLNDLAKFMDMDGETFKARAYTIAAEIVSEIENIKTLTYEDFVKISGIGKSIAEKIKEFNETGSIKKLDELRKEYPVKDELFELEGVGPKTVLKLFKELGVTDIASLKEVCENDKILSIPRMGIKMRDKILNQIK